MLACKTWTLTCEGVGLSHDTPNKNKVSDSQLYAERKAFFSSEENVGHIGRPTFFAGVVILLFKH